ncbi:hypothetical protein F5Y12DRAFT_782054 [Xylaria sp. FL1777]|nr:hypothetical protein F5Y12DRAFT_782054 [Xylaria sp. FL1777]
MRRLSGQSAFPKLSLASTRSWECQIRHIRSRRPRAGDPLRKQLPIYYLSDLILDLDAEGAKGVRAYDPRLDGTPEPTSAAKERELQPIKERVAEFEKRYDEYESKFKALYVDRFNPMHISDFDFLALTLLGPHDIPKTVADKSTYDKHNKPASYADVLGSVLDQNGVPHSIRDNTFNTITYMQFRRSSLPRELSAEELFPMTLKGGLAFPQIDRVVTKAMQTPQGCRRLSEISDELYESLLGVQETEPIQLLSLLNNILLNLDQYGLHLSSQLYELGIWTSLKCNAIITAHQYIERSLKHWDYNDDFLESILMKLSEASIASDSRKSYRFQWNVSSRSQAVFSLLTGYVPGEGQSIFSLRSLINRDKPHSFRLYMQCLARVGAFRTIWHEWHNPDFAFHTNVAVGPLSAFQENGSTARAIVDVLSKDFDNSYMIDLVRSPEFTKTTGQFWEDCQLDMVFISRSAEIFARPSKGIGDSSHSVAYARNREKVLRIFREDSIEKALPALQAFLLSNPSFS